MKTRKQSLLMMAVMIAAIFILASCDSDDDDSPVSFTDMELVSGDSAVIENGDGVTWTSENEYIASVSDNTVTAERVGTVKISSLKGSFSVTVTPQYNLYDEPCMKWGCSESTVRSFMSGYTLTKEMDNYLIYAGKGGASYIQYGFSDSALEGCVVYVPRSYVDELVPFLNERYLYLKKGDDYYGFLSIDKKTTILLTVTKLGSSYYYEVFYTENTTDSDTKCVSASLPETEFAAQSDKEELRQLTEDIDGKLKNLLLHLE